MRISSQVCGVKILLLILRRLWSDETTLLGAWHPVRWWHYTFSNGTLLKQGKKLTKTGVEKDLREDATFLHPWNKRIIDRHNFKIDSDVSWPATRTHVIKV